MSLIPDWSVLGLNAAVFALAVALDRFLPEPPARIHPVVWMGRAVTTLEHAAPRRPAAAFTFGCLIVVAVVGGSAVLVWLLMETLMSLGPVPYVVGGALVLRTSFTVRGLSSAADQTRHALARGRLDAAREKLKSLVSRDTANLSEPLVAASAIESVAENTTDSYVGPWLAFAALGVPGAVAYRAINTLDSMLGYRGRYEYLGKASAILDDVVNLVPARLSALFLLASGGVCRLPTRRAWRIMRQDRGKTESPNAGVTISAMSGLLGARLEKPGSYCLGGCMRQPETSDIRRAVRLAEITGVMAAAVTLAFLAARHVVAGL